MNWVFKHYEILGKQAVKALNDNKFTARYVPNKASAIESMMALIPEGSSVGLGGSITLAELKIKRMLLERGIVIYTHAKLPPDEALAARKKQLTADVFVASANAITLKGEIINVDATGNRVAAMIFGPKRVILIVGANKIVCDEAEGRNRIKNLAAPVNALSLSKNAPCTITGVCIDCKSHDRICCVTSIIHRAPMHSDFHVIIVGESLGY